MALTHYAKASGGCRGRPRVIEILEPRSLKPLGFRYLPNPQWSLLPNAGNARAHGTDSEGRRVALESPNVMMTGYNRGSELLKAVTFYVSALDTPFLEPVR